MINEGIDRRTLIGHPVAKSGKKYMNISRRNFLVTGAGSVAASAFARPARADEARVFEIALRGAKIVNAETTIRVIEGDTVELHWSSDGEIELHLHGYDIEIEIEAGGSGVMTFEAFATGRFPIVAHGDGASHAPFAYLEVHPD